MNNLNEMDLSIEAGFIVRFLAKFQNFRRQFCHPKLMNQTKLALSFSKMCGIDPYEYTTDFRYANLSRGINIKRRTL